MTQNPRRPEIDGLRAFAVLPVLIAHAWPEILPGGHLGVDVFFVLSGYLITGLLLTGIEAGSFSFGEFYRRRMLRLMPAFFLVLFVTLGASWLIHTASETRTTVLTAAFAAISASNFYLPTTGGYFAAEANTNPLLHTWSLAVEEQFYLVFPLVLLLFLRRAPGRLEAALTLVAGASLVYALCLEAIHSPWAHYSSPGRVWELLVGALLAIQLRRQTPADTVASMPAAKVVGWLSVLLLAGVYLVDMSDSDVKARMLACGATIGIIWGLHVGVGRLMLLLQMRALVYVGLISYSLYLWHQPVMAFARLVFPASSLPFLIGTVVLSLVLAISTYHLVEAPLRRARTSLPRILQIFVLCLGLVGLFIISAVRSDFFAARDAGHPLYAVLHHPDHAAAKRCMFWSKSLASDVEFCQFDASTSDETTPVVAIWGDSHAGSLVLGFMGMHRPYGLLHLGMSGCRLDLRQTRQAPVAENCTKKHTMALGRILSDDTVKVVIFHSRWYSGGPSKRIAGELSAMEVEMERAMEILQDAGKQVILVTAVPTFDVSVPHAMIRSSRLGLDFAPKKTLSDHHADPERMIKGASEVAERQGVHVVSSDGIFCPDGTCISTMGRLPLYQDDDHIGVLGARLLAIEIDPVIRDILDMPPYLDHRVEMERDLMGGMPSR